MPKNDILVLVGGESPVHDFPCIAHFTAGGWWQLGTVERLHSVTHWMPLPDKPE